MPEQTEAIIKAIARLEANYERSREDLAEVKTDARDARDTAQKLLAVFTEQKLGENIAKLSAKVDSVDQNMRHDLVNAVTKAREEGQRLAETVRSELKAGDAAVLAEVKLLETDLKPLVEDYQRREGGSVVVKTLREWGGWIAALGVALTTLAGRLPHP